MTDFYEESCYLSNGEAEADSETDDFAPIQTPMKSDELAWDDPQALLNAWLGELDSLEMGLESSAAAAAAAADTMPAPRPVDETDKLPLPNEQRIDSYRFSLANLEDSQDGELDAILKELCVLGSRLDHELKTDSRPNGNTSQHEAPVVVVRSPSNRVHSTPDAITRPALNNDNNNHEAKNPPPHSRATNSGGCAPNKLKIELVTDNVEPPSSRTETGLRTESPDNDSAFSDNISMLSSESSASSGASAARTSTSTKSSASSTGSSTLVAPAADEAAARLKAEKIRLALDKIREANVKKLFIKAFTGDGSTKSLLVDENMSVGHVMRMLADKNHVRLEPKWVLVEHLPDLYMERYYEDHEMLVDQLMLWTRDSRNTLLFVERPEKYNLFANPEHYLLTGSSSEKHRQLDDDARQTLTDEFFSGLGGVGVPDVEGPLYLKAEGKKAWKKFYFVLRASGIYYSPKGKATSRSSRDLVCLATFDVNQVYSGVNWRKKYKAPSDFGFAIKHPKLQSRSSKLIKYLCAEDEQTMAKWMAGIRIAKHGRTLMDNYRALVDELAQEDLDRLASARSFSLASMTPLQVAVNASESRAQRHLSAAEDTVGVEMNAIERAARPLSRQDSIKSGRTSTSSSSTSGCVSERSSAGTATPTLPEIAFEMDSPMGTIKRKPSMTPKLPLTSTTRLLVKEIDDSLDGHMAVEARNTFRQSFRKSLTDEVNTIRRKTSTSTNSVSSMNSTLSVSSTSSTGSVVDCAPCRLPIPEAADTPDVDLLPLPPPPTFTPPDDALESDHDALPPPPPEAFDHEEIPPPVITETPVPAPQVPPEVPVALKPCLKNASGAAPRVPPKPSIVTFPRRDSVDCDQSGIYANSAGLSPVAPSIATTLQHSPIKKNRRITFDDRVARSPSPPPLTQKRIDPLRSSLKQQQQQQQQPMPQKLTAPGCTVTPPRAFLNDLQRVMQKKWQVAQKCKDEEVTPHSVLGFRDAPPPAPVPAAYKENSVRAWVAEHYGPGVTDDPSVSFYENVFVPSNSLAAAVAPAEAAEYSNCVELRRCDYTHPYLPVQPLAARISSASSTGTAVSGGGSAKRPPPPPPKRSETTHLSTRIH